MGAANLFSLFGRLQRPFPVPAKTASAVARGRGQGRPVGRRAVRAFLDGDEHGRTLLSAGRSARKPRAWRATVLAFWLTGTAYAVVVVPAVAAPQVVREATLAELVDEAAVRFGLPVSWIEAVIAVESGGAPAAVSPKGAMGLMQLMPLTWRELRAELGLGSDPFDRRSNILAGAAYLRRLYDRFGRSGFLAAYNAGPARYQALLDGGRKLPAETIAYVAAVEARISRSGGVQRGQSVPRLTDWRRSGIFVPSMAGPSQASVEAAVVTVVETAEPAVRP